VAKTRVRPNRATTHALSVVAADRRAATLNWVKRVDRAFGFCLAAAALFGCGQSSLAASKPAPQADIETRATPQKQPRELPRLIAPPPKYGNKIVMAKASSVAPLN